MGLLAGSEIKKEEGQRWRVNELWDWRKEGGKDYQLSVQSPAGYVIGGEGKKSTAFFPCCQSVWIHSVSTLITLFSGGFIGFSVGAKDMGIKLRWHNIHIFKCYSISADCGKMFQPAEDTGMRDEIAGGFLKGFHREKKNYAPLIFRYSFFKYKYPSSGATFGTNNTADCEHFPPCFWHEFDMSISLFWRILVAMAVLQKSFSCTVVG